MSGHIDSYYQSIIYIHQIVFKIKDKITGPWNIGHAEWPSLRDPQVHVTRLSHVRPIICLSWFHNRKVEKHFLKCLRFWPLAPSRGMDPGMRSHGMKADPPGYLWSKYECFLMSGWWDILHSSCLHVKHWSNSTNRTKYEQTNERTHERKDENYIPLGINAGGIITTGNNPKRIGP